MHVQDRAQREQQQHVQDHEASERHLDPGQPLAEHLRSNFLCNLGYGDASALKPRLPRLNFDEVCAWA